MSKEIFRFKKIANAARDIARGRCTSLQKLSCEARATQNEYLQQSKLFIRSIWSRVIIS